MKTSNEWRLYWDNVCLRSASADWNRERAHCAGRDRGRSNRRLRSHTEHLFPERLKRFRKFGHLSIEQKLAGKSVCNAICDAG